MNPIRTDVAHFRLLEPAMPSDCLHRPDLTNSRISSRVIDCHLSRRRDGRQALTFGGLAGVSNPFSPRDDFSDGPSVRRFPGVLHVFNAGRDIGSGGDYGIRAGWPYRNRSRSWSSWWLRCGHNIFSSVCDSHFCFLQLLSDIRFDALLRVHQFLSCLLGGKLNLLFRCGLRNLQVRNVPL